MQNNYTYLPMVCIANEIQVFFFSIFTQVTRFIIQPKYLFNVMFFINVLNISNRYDS